MSRWIVVGTDFGTPAELALEHAIELAVGARSKIALVHVYLDPDRDEDLLRGELEARLRASIEHSPAGGCGVHVEPLLRRGSVWDKLRNVATDMGAEHIVIGQAPSSVLVVPHARKS